jgi:hypothetical protein
VAITEFGDVLAAAQQGSHWAIAVLWQELHPRLLRFLRGLDPDAESRRSERALRHRVVLGLA